MTDSSAAPPPDSPAHGTQLPGPCARGAAPRCCCPSTRCWGRGTPQPRRPPSSYRSPAGHALPAQSSPGLRAAQPRCCPVAARPWEGVTFPTQLLLCPWAIGGFMGSTAAKGAFGTSRIWGGSAAGQHCQRAKRCQPQHVAACGARAPGESCPSATVWQLRPLLPKQRRSGALPRVQAARWPQAPLWHHRAGTCMRFVTCLPPLHPRAAPTTRCSSTFVLRPLLTVQSQD